MPSLRSALIGEFLGTALLILLGDGVVASVLLLNKEADWIVITTGWVGVALFGAIVFVGLQELTNVSPTNSAWIAIALTFVIRMLAVRYNWRTWALRAPPT